MNLARKLARLVGLLSSLALLAASAASANLPKRDRYGGVKERVMDAPGYFRTLKVGNRWILVYRVRPYPFWVPPRLRVSAVRRLIRLADPRARAPGAPRVPA